MNTHIISHWTQDVNWTYINQRDFQDFLLGILNALMKIFPYVRERNTNSSESK